MKQSFTASLWREGEWFIAQCAQVDVANQGSIEEEAVANLRDALELQFTPPIATEKPQMREIDIRAA